MAPIDAWLPQAQQLDEHALSEIYQALSPALFRYAYRLLGNAADAENIVAETFHRLLLALRHGNGPRAHLSAYLYRIARNLITDRYRRGPQPSRTPQAMYTAQPPVTNTPQNHSYGPGATSTSQPIATPVGQSDGHEYGSGAQPTTVPDNGGGNGEPQPQATPHASNEPQNPPQPGGDGSASDPQPATTPRGSGGTR